MNTGTSENKIMGECDFSVLLCHDNEYSPEKLNDGQGRKVWNNEERNLPQTHLFTKETISYLSNTQNGPSDTEIKGLTLQLIHVTNFLLILYLFKAL